MGSKNGRWVELGEGCGPTTAVDIKESDQP